MQVVFPRVVAALEIAPVLVALPVVFRVLRGRAGPRQRNLRDCHRDGDPDIVPRNDSQAIRIKRPV